MDQHYGTWAEFVAQVEQLLAPTAAGKGYSTTGVDGQNPLFEFVSGVAQGPGHALGEIVYKAVRYGRKRNPEDVLKIAAWAFLVWRHHQAPALTGAAVTVPCHCGRAVADPAQCDFPPCPLEQRASEQ